MWHDCGATQPPERVAVHAPDVTEAPAAKPVGSGNPSLPTKSLGPLSGTRVGDDAPGRSDGAASLSGRRRKSNIDMVGGWSEGGGGGGGA